MNAFTSREHTAYYPRLPAAELEPRPRPARRRGERAGVPAPRGRRRARGHPRGDPHERGHPRRPRAHRALREPLPRAPARPRDPRHPRVPSRPWAATTSPPSTQRWYRPANLVVAAAGDLAHDEVRRRASTACFDVGEPGVRARARTRPGTDVVPAGRRSTGRPSRPTWPSAGGRCPSTTPTATPSGSPTTSSAAACRAGCSRRSARSGAWPTRCSRRRRPTATPASLVDLRRHHPEPPRRAARGRSTTPIDGLVADGITDEEHEVALGYLEGSMLLGLEDTGRRMARLGSGVTIRDEVISVDEHVRRIRAVTADDVPPRAAPGVRRAPAPVAAVGPARRRTRRRSSTFARRGKFRPPWSIDRSASSAPAGAWAARCAGRSPPTPTSSSSPRSTRTTRASTCARSPASTCRSRSRPTAEAFLDAGVEVAVDFTLVDAGPREPRCACAEHGVHAVVGTTGFTDDDYDALRGRVHPLATASSPRTSPSARC